MSENEQKQSQQELKTKPTSFTNNNFSKGEEVSIRIGTGINIAGKAWGPKDSNKKILALHGWLDNANTFDFLAPVMADQGYRIICIDFIGHGLSPHKPSWCNLYYTDYITQVLDVAEALQWKTFTIMGHSMGAGIASILAATMSHLVERIICLDFIGILSKEVDQVKAIQFAMQTRSSINQRKPNLYSNKQDIFDKLKSNNPWIADNAANRLLERSIESVISNDGEQMYKLRHDPRLVGPSIFIMREAEVLLMLDEIKCPVLVCWADVTKQQMLINRNWTQVMETRMKHIKNLSQVIVKGSHHFHMENIDAFSSNILEFLEKDQDISSFEPQTNAPNQKEQQQLQKPDNHNQIVEKSSPQLEGNNTSANTEGHQYSKL
ncbi:hypothetical protein DICPUDRAFT_152421 [Dictyostelium purpureum]|uniref:AB hydrolase-1 domain-containing protein n=1 Tax=Dictyostelium purpureum TaxID=5786 RepID=F0ZLB3_DICPU|nr:uncharacterized protein DICPUDRAFT_152421 [Dictyostelium purpureum]EGC35284.1 hypothetical protein DICPUDRAFT_152421 [Dictyostelium purpureum]|eukprot:XP_003288210.1 hypothetical protein DICPUDRAFT_152421 [Dictyostelium purpureum]